MPVILSQRFIGDDQTPKYKDVETVIYHYPRVYFKRVLPNEQFIYYRPQKGTRAVDAGSYFGYGKLGVPFPDMLDSNLRFVDIRGFQRFPRHVPLRQGDDSWIETGSVVSPQFQASVREISLYDYHRILIAGGIHLLEIESIPTTDGLLDGLVSPLFTAPLDAFRSAEQIPEGTGYAWQGSALPNLAESAALQERARSDHQRILRKIATAVKQRGGSWWYNNNIDLYAQIGERKLLIEAKSLVNLDRAVDRMRYGMGQLFDYRVRYNAVVGGATPVLAFGTAPARADAWIANILQANDIALVALTEGKIRALNEHAETLPIIDFSTG